MVYGTDAGWGRAHTEPDSGGWGAALPDNEASSRGFMDQTHDMRSWSPHQPPPPNGPYSPPPPGGSVGMPPGGMGGPPPPSNTGLPPITQWMAVDGRGEEMISRTIFICKLPGGTTEKDLVEWFVRCSNNGDIRKVSYHADRQIAFVDFWDIRHSEAARKNSQEGIWMNFRHYPDVRVVYGKPKDPPGRGQYENTGTVYVRPREKNGPPDSNSKEAYRQLFEQFGQIKQITCNRKRESEKFIEYFDLRAASKALSLSGYTFNGTVLEVQMSKNQSKNYNTSSVTRSDRRTDNNSSSGGYHSVIPPTRDDIHHSVRNTIGGVGSSSNNGIVLQPMGPPSGGPSNIGGVIGGHGGSLQQGLHPQQGGISVSDYYKARYFDHHFTGKHALEGRMTPIDLSGGPPPPPNGVAHGRY